MTLRPRRRVTREEKFALGTALLVFACMVVLCMILKVSSYMKPPPPEPVIVFAPNALSPILLAESPSLNPQKKPEAPRAGRTIRAVGVPVPVHTGPQDTLRQSSTNGGRTSDTSAAAPQGGEEQPFSALDSLIIRYPGFRSFALGEQAHRRYPKSKKDSIIAWAKASFDAQMAKYGRIDPSTLNRLLMLENSRNAGPYHITTPQVGVSIPFSYTDILKKIRSWFEKEPDE